MPYNPKASRTRGKPSMEKAKTKRANSVDISFFQKGLKVWTKNPYPEGDGAYRNTYKPTRESARPLFVPARVINNTGDKVRQLPLFIMRCACLSKTSYMDLSLLRCWCFLFLFSFFPFAFSN